MYPTLQNGRNIFICLFHYFQVHIVTFYKGLMERNIKILITFQPVKNEPGGKTSEALERIGCYKLNLKLSFKERGAFNFVLVFPLFYRLSNWDKRAIKRAAVILWSLFIFISSPENCNLSSRCRHGITIYETGKVSRAPFSDDTAQKHEKECLCWRTFAHSAVLEARNSVCLGREDTVIVTRLDKPILHLRSLF